MDAMQTGLLALDSHIDIPWPATDDPTTLTARCVDFPKMRAGGVTAGCFAAYIPQGTLDDAGHGDAVARATAMLAEIGRLGRAEGVRLCETADEVRAAFAEGARAVVACIENGYAMGRELSRLERFRRAGVRYITLTHNGHNLLADSAIPRRDLGDSANRHGGLSALGRAAIAEMNILGILVDVSHAHRDTMLQAAKLSRTPVVATHACARALCDHPRNLDDEQLRVLKDTGGLIQITAMGSFLRRGGKRLDGTGVGIADFVDHIDYVIDRIGVDHVGIGSDFDGGGGIEGFATIADSPAVTAEFHRRGYDDDAIAAIWGGNFLRLMEVAERG